MELTETPNTETPSSDDPKMVKYLSLLAGKRHGNEILKKAPIEVKTRFTEILERFRKSSELEYTFEESMNKVDRAVVHMLCSKMGLVSQSKGSGSLRCVSIYKNVKGKKLTEQIKRKKEMSNTITEKGMSQTMPKKNMPKVAKKKINVNMKAKKLTEQIMRKKEKSNTITEKGMSQTMPKNNMPKVVKKHIGVAKLVFSEDSKEVLRQLFTRFPPDNEDMVEKLVRKCDTKSKKRLGSKDDIFGRPIWDRATIARKLESLSSKMKNSKELRQITEKRSTLPIASFKDVITSTVESHQVVLISGETGCGKTTQVPQYLLDYMWSKGEACNLVCTQPRRISAISVAERISFERGQEVGDDVGYKIRLESSGGRNSSIVFCTNGILLKVLVSECTGTVATKGSAKDRISDISHIVVDEIHERDHYSDFSLAILRDMLPSYPNLRLILMSATLDAERFSQYFGGCPIIRVPGFTYPVKTYYLEDVLSLLNSIDDNHTHSTSLDVPTQVLELTKEFRDALDEAISLAWTTDDCDSLLDLISTQGTPKVFNYQHSLNGLTPLMVLAGKGRVGDVCLLLSLGADCYLKANDGTTAYQLAERRNQHEAVELLKKHTENALVNTVEEQQLLDKYMSTINPLFIDVILIKKLLTKLCSDSEDGGILVFLPGWEDISRTRDNLLADPLFKDPSKFVIIALHSMVSSEDQQKVFTRPNQGCRKIVLSTNIAESSVTIDDIVYVINGGRMKEKSYDPISNVSTLTSAWISKASARQRAGRAGRCQPGTCYHLYSKFQAKSMSEFQVPEIQRMPIEELCLQVKLIDPNLKIEEFLQKAMDPPVFETIRNGITCLQDIGALASDEKLTELGEKLAFLPVHPRTSKMLFFSILFCCLDPALTLACVSDLKSPFILPMSPDDRTKAEAAKLDLASIYGGYSDELAIIAAFECWKNANGRAQQAKFCSNFFVSHNTMRMLSRMRERLQEELIRNKFIPKNVTSCNLNARDPGILHAALVAGLYPKVGKLFPSPRGTCVVEIGGGEKIRLHPRSTNSNRSFEKHHGRPYVIYEEIILGDRGLSMRSCSIVGPLPLALFAKEIAVASIIEEKEECNDSSVAEGIDMNEEAKEKHDDKSNELVEEKILSSPDKLVHVVLDKWLSFASAAIDVAQICCLRQRLSAAILFKIKYPQEALDPCLEASIYAISCVLSFDGLSGINVPPKKKSLAVKEEATEVKKPAGSITSLAVEEDADGSGPSEYLKSLMGQVPSRKPVSVSHLPIAITINSTPMKVTM